MILRYTAVLIFIVSACYFSTLAHAGNDNAFTSYEKVADGVFSPVKLARTNRQPTQLEAKQIQAMRDVLLEAIDGSGPVWFSKIAQPSIPTQTQWSVAREVLQHAPVWICNERCSCSSDQPFGCASARLIGDAAVSIIFLDQCVLNGNCSLSLTAAGSNNLVRAMANSFAMAAWFSVHRSVDRQKAKEAVTRGWSVISKSILSMERIAASCPGPFAENGETFLRQTGHLKELNPFIDRCAKKLLDRIRTKSLPLSCKTLIDPVRWERYLGGGVLWDDPRTFRCDDLCESLTCAPRGDYLPRIMRFGSKWLMSIPEGVCDGSTPVDVAVFVEHVIRATAKKSEARKPNARAMLKSCVQALVSGTVTPSESTKIAPSVPLDNPGVELIE